MKQWGPPLLLRRRSVEFQALQNFVCETARDALRNLRMGSIPVLWPRLNGESDGILVIPADFLEIAHIDFANPLQLTLGRILEAISEYLPMLGEWDNRESADRNILSFEQTRGGSCSVPLFGVDGADDVLVGADWHRSSGKALR